MSNPTPEKPPLTLRAFAESLYHGERANNYFKFLRTAAEDDLDQFFQGLLREVGDAIDTADTTALARFVQQAQARGYAPPPDASSRPSQMLQLAEPVPLPQAALAKPLKQARVALFSTGGVYLAGQEPPYPPEWSYDEAVRKARTFFERVPRLARIPRDAPLEEVRVGHIAYDLRAAQRDLNVMLPLTRFHELEAAGEIGELAPTAYSFHGLTNVPRLRDEFAPLWAEEIRQAGVDAVFLTPG